MILYDNMAENTTETDNNAFYLNKHADDNNTQYFRFQCGAATLTVWPENIYN